MDYLEEWVNVKKFCTEFAQSHKQYNTERHEDDLLYASNTPWLSKYEYYKLPKITVTHYGHLVLHLLEAQLQFMATGKYTSCRCSKQKLSEYLQCATIHLVFETDAYRFIDTNYFGDKVREFSPTEHNKFKHILQQCVDTIPMPQGTIINYKEYYK